ncbi:hypothetical protein DVJ78_08280 [Humibacter sp. BT305]|nr:hypothetical protein DVJ78_08280 [Humibacter sp. BT305]
MLHGWPTTPAYVLDSVLTVVIANDPARDVMPEAATPGANVVLTVFGEAWRELDLDWDRTARRVVAAVRVI